MSSTSSERISATRSAPKRRTQSLSMTEERLLSLLLKRATADKLE
ncbi:MAG: hypothetical protein ABR992_17690 [Solirubrobacteraceae bacterium]